MITTKQIALFESVLQEKGARSGELYALDKKISYTLIDLDNPS